MRIIGDKGSTNGIRRRRRGTLACAAGVFLLMFGGPVRADANFDKWREELWLEAKSRGIDRRLFDEATNVPLDLTLSDLVIPGRPVKEQAEFQRLPSEYISQQQISQLARKGRQHLATYGKLLRSVEAKYGVPGNVVIAIWGRETDYGAEQQRHYVIPSLVTLAYLGKRKDMFREELLIALELVREGAISINAMGSWTGAMGHTQFEPSDFRKFAADGDGDGKIDLENSIPDALASAAKQLQDYGWKKSKRWAIEVRLPAEVSCVESSPEIKRTLGEWLELGLLPAPNMGVSFDMLEDQATLVLPAGIYGPAFLAFENFQVFRRYNQSDVYAIFVGHLADRIAGGPVFEKAWAKLPPINNREIAEIQRMLRDFALYAGSVDGRLGPATRRAIGQYQQSTGQKVDCWPGAIARRYGNSTAAQAPPSAKRGPNPSAPK
ncbi:lytic murein transglycosylase [Bradyrhizobium sp. 180]|uniref:lytic murein transglycosylase n=1 Tax=Bradyrhizobium sp. 180 TaxID=2782650 RepID=UPI001FFB4D7D|nr:lytic murein transglycosylase [Bradyrhizobium sp. 180]MCK1489744.1 lytic murein transglycosylase [Bradyrhizobium sp. 180]